MEKFLTKNSYFQEYFLLKLINYLLIRHSLLTDKYSNYTINQTDNKCPNCRKEIFFIDDKPFVNENLNKIIDFELIFNNIDVIDEK